MEFQWLTGLSAGGGLTNMSLLASSNGLALNWLALVRNGCGLQYCLPVMANKAVYKDKVESNWQRHKVISMRQTCCNHEKNGVHLPKLNDDDENINVCPLFWTTIWNAYCACL